MQGIFESSCARGTGLWRRAALTGIAASVLAMTAAKADPRVDADTAAAAPATVAAQADTPMEDKTAPSAPVAPALSDDPQIGAEMAARPEPTSAPSDPSVAGEATASAETAPDPSTYTCSAGNLDQHGVASWYGRHWRGRRTASGRRFDDRRLTAASLSLPLATRARVTNLRNGRSVDVLVNDRGPYIGGRIIDLSARAAQLLGMTRTGLAYVAVTALPAPARSSI